MVETAADTTQRSWLGGNQRFAASRLLRRRLVPLKNAHQAPERIAIASFPPCNLDFSCYNRHMTEMEVFLCHDHSAAAAYAANPNTKRLLPQAESERMIPSC